MHGGNAFATLFLAYRHLQQQPLAESSRITKSPQGALPSVIEEHDGEADEADEELLKDLSGAEEAAAAPPPDRLRASTSSL